jgi:hypothetical protein
MGIDIGETVYDLRAGEDKSWPVIGKEVTRRPVMGFTGKGQPTERLSIVGWVTDANPAEIPAAGLSLYDGAGKVRFGEEGAWYCAGCIRAGSLRRVELSTEPPP